MIGSWTSTLNQSLHSYGFDHALLHLDPIFVIGNKRGAYKMNFLILDWVELFVFLMFYINKIG
jgi:hypothetical protein